MATQMITTNFVVAVQQISLQLQQGISYVLLNMKHHIIDMSKWNAYISDF